jgi:hypothetical protein
MFTLVLISPGQLLFSPTEIQYRFACSFLSKFHGISVWAMQMNEHPLYVIISISDFMSLFRIFFFQEQGVLRLHNILL